MTRPQIAVGLLALGLLAGACQRPSAPPPQAAADDATEAAEALEAREYGKAALLYRRALAKDPDNLGLHYGLGVAASHLGLRPEAVREMTWVHERGERGSREVAVAEHWLRSVGALRPTAWAPVSRRTEREEERLPDRGRIEGRALFGEPGDVRPMRRMKLSFIGQPGSPTKEARYTVRTDEDGRFRVANAIPGPYKLTDRIAGQPIWRLRVEVKPGETQALDLTPGNSVKVRDDFRGEP